MYAHKAAIRQCCVHSHFCQTTAYRHRHMQADESALPKQTEHMVAFWIG